MESETSPPASPAPEAPPEQPNQFLPTKEDPPPKELSPEEPSLEEPPQLQPFPKPHTTAKPQRRLERGVQSSPQYFRVDNQVCHKLFETYKRLHIGHEGNVGTFDMQDQSSQCLNYHKILQMCKDMNVKLQVGQKLQILRAIKKFSFNQQMINQKQFNQVFKVMVHGVGIREPQLRHLAISKYQPPAERIQHQMMRKGIHVRLNKNLPGRKKMKTQPGEIGGRGKSYGDGDGLVKEHNTLQTLEHCGPHRRATYNETMIGHSGGDTGRKITSRRRIATEAKQVDSQKYEVKGGYLNRAMQRNKVSKLSWQTLFAMKENNLPTNVIIPHFISEQTPLPDDILF